METMPGLSAEVSGRFRLRRMGESKGVRVE